MMLICRFLPLNVTSSLPLTTMPRIKTIILLSDSDDDNEIEGYETASEGGRSDVSSQYDDPELDALICAFAALDASGKLRLVLV